MAGIQANVLTDKKSGNKISFALYENNTKPGRIVFRSKWQTGRRFELARILGDRIARQQSSRLSPATRSYTYRQKLQRSFAAEFLSPFEFVDEMLAGDYSMESQQEAAEYFDVSPMTIRTLLVNHKRIERDTLDFDTSADELFAGQSS
jgi:Zn-dependent peptidase ImmA (M78 family)